jgi:hypothetical protein
MVLALAGLRVGWDEMRQIVLNPHTDRPIAKATFARVFKRELAEGGARLKQLISSKYYEALHDGRDWAIRAGLKNRFGWVFEGQQPPPVLDAVEGTPSINVTFHLPSRKGEPPPPLDVTPQAPQRPPDYSKPALPPPPERRRGPLSWIEERPSKDGWMK